MLKCPQCGADLEPNLNKYQDNDADYVEVELHCENEHPYFVRIKEDDLLES